MGAAGDDDGGVDAGSAYLFQRDGSKWGEQTKLTAADAETGDQFGVAVAIGGSFAIVGATGDDDGGNDAGAVYIYRFDGSTWIEQDKITAGDAATGDHFGASVSISGSYVLIGAPGNDDGGDDSGAVYIFKFDGSTWNEADKLSAGDATAGDNFGGAVAIDGANVFVGAAGDDDGGAESGAAYAYTIESYYALNISADPQIIGPGESATLAWSSVNIDSAIIDHSIGAVPPNGSIAVSPTATATYTITAQSRYGKQTASVTVFRNRAPSIAVLEPDVVNDTADTRFVILWIDDDPEDDAKISLYFDTDNQGADGTLIVSGLNEDGDGPGNDDYDWDTTLIWQGNYYIYAVIDDGFNEPVVAYSDGIVSIDHGSALLNELKFFAADAQENDLFGLSISISGDFAIVGAPGVSHSGTRSGAAYIFIRDGSGWTEQVKLTADNAEAYDGFGGSVSISGDYAIVGASGDDDGGSNAGAAYIFKRVGSDWLKQAKLSAGDAAANDSFGVRVSISGDRAIISAPYNDHYHGAAYIFARNGSDWTEQAKLSADDGSGFIYFGYSVGISGGYAIVGAPGDDGFGRLSGSAYIFKHEGSGWVKQAKLAGNDTAAYDFFGDSVAIDGNFCIVSAVGNDAAGPESGSAYIFKRDDSVWVEHGKLTAGDAAASDYFGDSVSIDGNFCIVGAHRKNDAGQNTGAAYIFKNIGTAWIEYSKLTASDQRPDQYFGFSTAISGNYIAVGAPQDNDYGDNSGSAYFNTIAPLYADAVPVEILAGESTTLSWSSFGADSCEIEPGIGSVDPNGTLVLSPLETTTYTVTASGPYGEATARVTVTVNHPLPIVTLTAVPDAIQTGASAILQWSSSHADSVVLDNGIGDVELTGPFAVSPETTTTYTLTATGPGGNSTATVTVRVVETPPTVTIAADPASIVPGETSTLSWNTTDALSCVIEPGVGSVAVTGAITVSLAETTTYTIEAANPAGTTIDSVTVTVVHPLPTVNLSVDSATIVLGESATLSWISTFASSAVIEPGIGSVEVNGSTLISPTETTTYTITVTGPGGMKTDNVTVAVIIAPPEGTISADPEHIKAGESCTLTWTVIQADIVAIEPGIGSVESNGSLEVAPDETTTYTLTATGPGGTTTAQITVDVTAPIKTRIRYQYDAVGRIKKIIREQLP